MRNLRLLLVALLPLLLAACDPQVGPGRWNNPLDPDGTDYHPPLPGLSDTAIKDPESGILAAHFWGMTSPIANVFWTVDGFPTVTGDTLLPTAGWSVGPHVVTVRGSDARGLAGPAKTVSVWIGNRPPALVPLALTNFDARLGARFVLSGMDPDGTLDSIAWDTVPDRYSVRSPDVVLADTSGGSRVVYWRLVDTEGAVAIGTQVIGFVPSPVVDAMLDLGSPSIVGSTGNSLGSASSTVQASLRGASVLPILVTVAVPGFPDEATTLTVSDGQTELGCSRTSANQISTIKHPYAKTYLCNEPIPASLQAQGKQGSSSITVQASNRFGATSSTKMVINYTSL